MNDRPTVRAVRREGDHAELDLFIPASLEFFPHHFPRLAILPGVIQVDWAIAYGREHLPLDGAFRGLRNVKFMNPVLPGATVTLSLDRKAGELAFAYRAGERTYSSGRALFA
jgi:3-hydroxymyristoyl/3-hydroxydecanoyl-(acyl carrier protein) dehydratase